jgi:hypothetical protein
LSYSGWFGAGGEVIWVPGEDDQLNCWCVSETSNRLTLLSGRLDLLELASAILSHIVVWPPTRDSTRLKERLGQKRTILT